MMVRVPIHFFDDHLRAQQLDVAIRRQEAAAVSHREIRSESSYDGATSMYGAARRLTHTIMAGPLTSAFRFLGSALPQASSPAGETTSPKILDDRLTPW